MPSTRATLALIPILLFAGCLGAPGTGETTSPGTETPPTLEPTADVVDYRDLPDGTRSVVRAAVESGSVTTDTMQLDGLAPGETTHRRYDGTLYRLAWRDRG